MFVSGLTPSFLSVYNIALARETLNKQQQFSEEAAEQAYQRQIDMYKNFFSPEAMMKQYKEAGLSPGLIYAKGGVGGSSSAAPMATTPSATVPYVNPLIGAGQMAEAMNVVKTLTEAQKTKSETKMNEVKIDEIKKNIEQADANIKLLEAKAGTEVLTQMNLKLDADLKEIEKKYQGDTLQDRVKMVSEQLNVMIAQEENLWTDLNGKEIDNTWKPKMYEAERDLKNAQKELFIEQKVLPAAQAALAKAQEKLAKAQKDTEEQRKSQIEKDTKRLQYILDEYEKWGYKATEANNWATEVVALAKSLLEHMFGNSKGSDEWNPIEKATVGKNKENMGEGAGFQSGVLY